MQSPSTLCGVVLAAVLLSGNVHAASVTYKLTGMTNVSSLVPSAPPLTEVPISGTATLDFQGSRVTLTELSLSFEGLGEQESRGLLFLNGGLSVSGGGGLRSGSVLSFEDPSFAALTLTCFGRQDFCSAVLGSDSMLGVPKLSGMRGPFVLDSFAFDADGNFTTMQDFERLLPIGVSTGTASMAGASFLGVRLSATRVQVSEPTELHLAGLALLWVASLRTRPRRAADRSTKG